MVLEVFYWFLQVVFFWLLTCLITTIFWSGAFGASIFESFAAWKGEDCGSWYFVRS